MSCDCNDEALALTRGDTLAFTTTLYTQANKAQPQDLTGAKVWFTVKKYATDPDIRAVFQGDSTGPGVVVLAPAQSGRVTCTMPALATAWYPDQPVTLIWDIQVKLPSGAINTLKKGTILVTPDVTRATS